jgi:hypothetical protein
VSEAQRSDLLHLIQENKSADRHDTHREMNSKLEKTLTRLGMHLAADQVHNCHNTFIGWGCDHAHRWARPASSCQFKLCAFDMRARSARLVGKFRVFFESFVSPRYLVLSMRSCDLYELKEGIAALFAAFERLRHRRIWKQVRGAVAVLEVTFNRETRCWHPHLNVLVDGPYMPQADLLAEWTVITEGAGVAGVWIEQATADTLPELFKYVTKLVDFVEDVDAVREFLRGTKGLRFVRTYGEYYGFEVEDEKGALKCPDCGSTVVHRVGYMDAEQLWLDGFGVLRFDLPGAEWPPGQARGVENKSADFVLSAPLLPSVEPRRIDFVGVLPGVRGEVSSLFAAGV